MLLYWLKVLYRSLEHFSGWLFFLCQQNVSEGKTQVLYSLYGIVEHSGTMRSGHYTAYVKTRPNRQSMAPNGLAMQGRHFNFSVWSGVCYCVRNCMEVQLGNIHPICLWRFRVNLRHRQFSLQCLVHSLTSLDISDQLSSFRGEICTFIGQRIVPEKSILVMAARACSQLTDILQKRRCLL